MQQEPGNWPLQMVAWVWLDQRRHIRSSAPRVKCASIGGIVDDVTLVDEVHSSVDYMSDHGPCNGL